MQKILGIIHPRTSQYMEFNAELPDYFKHLLENFVKVVYISSDLMYNMLYIKSDSQMDLHKGA